MRNFLCFLTLLSFFSCSELDNQPATELSIDRETFVKDIGILTQKTNFRNLSFENKRDLWVSKLNQVLNSGLTGEHARLVSSINSILLYSQDEHMLHSNLELMENAVRLAEITPSDDFIEIFSHLENYRFSKFDLTHIDPTFALNVKSDFNKPRVEINKNARSNLPSCNCDWTCGDSLSECTHDQCESTSSGCGFLWLFSCKERDELLASDCP